VPLPPGSGAAYGAPRPRRGRGSTRATRSCRRASRVAGLDGLKAINDRLGHAAGVEALHVADVMM
jgi:GGDEF domain-containing protein